MHPALSRVAVLAPAHRLFAIGTLARLTACAPALHHPPKPNLPPRLQALWQGGCLVFKGRDLLFAHRDPGTAAHADLGAVVRIATEGL